MEQKFESELLMARELMPRLWWNIYQGCLSAGFDERQSFVMVQTYVLAQNATSGIRVPDEKGPKTDDPSV